MTDLNTKPNYTDADVRAMIAEADRVVVLSDFDDTLGYREGPATIISDAGRNVIETFNQHSGNGFIVITGKSRDQVIEQLKLGKGPDEAVHIPAVADQFGVKLWSQSQIEKSDDYVFVVDTSDKVFPNGMKGIAMLNSPEFVKVLENEKIEYSKIENSDLKSCIFLTPHTQETQNHYMHVAGEFIKKNDKENGDQIVKSLSFQQDRVFMDILIEGYTEKSQPSRKITHALLDIYEGERILVINAGDTRKTDGPMMAEVKGMVGANEPRLRVLNLGVGEHICDEPYVDIAFPGSKKESVEKLVNFFNEVVNPAIIEHHKTHVPSKRVDTALVEHFRAAHEAAAPKQDNTPKDTPSRPHNLRLVAGGRQ